MREPATSGRTGVKHREEGPQVLYFAPCGLREGVGGSARLKNMLDILERLGTNIHLISYVAGEKSRVEHERMGHNLDAITVQVKRSLPRVFKLFGVLQVLTYGLRDIGKSDIVVAHSPSVVSGFPARVLASVFRKPLIVDHMDVNDPATPRLVYNHVLRHSIVFAISRYLEREARELGCRKVIYVPIFIDADTFQRDAAWRASIRRELGVDDGELLIGYAGSFWHVEGLPFLLRAFGRLSGSHESTRLVIVGGRNAPDSDDVPRLIDELGLKGRVILVPQQPYERMPKYLSAFDIACSPKIDCAENRAANPIKIYEYMSMGLPAVASAVGGISDAIEDGVDGFLVEPGNEAALQGRLEYVIRNPDLAREAGRKAREKILKNYTQNAMSERIGDVLRQLRQERERAIP